MILNGQKVEIDPLFEPIIKTLNKKGYLTTNCCSGHIDNLYSYIMFHPEVDLLNYPPYYAYSYPNIISRYFKKNSIEDDLIKNAQDVLKWAKKLSINPIKIWLE